MTTDGPAVQPAPAPQRPAVRRRWLVVAAGVWAVLVIAFAIYAVHRGGSTVREQTSVAHALPTVDRAIAEAVTAAGPAGAVAEIDGYREVSGHCMITTARAGARYQRAAYLYVPVGREPALLDGIAARLPRGYDARVSGSGAHALTADAGDFVTLEGGISGPGEVRLTADTGCRPLTRPVSEHAPTPSAADRAPVEVALSALKLSAVRWQAHRVDCARGGAVRTVRADGPPGTVLPPLAGALRAVAPDAVVVRPDLYVYRSGPAGVVVRTADGVSTVTATTGCGGQ
ncbi:hypothetical protein HC031_06040 [Planosporangium thailandense]|uniref:DUF2993 domain-containing protein n=1 Tax=Planosporangium thailandense TaxID=765197 RepID=A0ABX0XTY1_9ACTN|nr:hypothetical protein [Planosporangium thailandense]NJC69281.1 hypothetical protein [Planosporangium thailandense]